MKFFQIDMLAAAGLGVLMVPLATFGAGGMAQKGSPSNVLVVNTPSQPVPVNGTVNVGNTSASPVPVKAVDNPAMQPFQASADSSAANGSIFANFNVAVVPAGKRLVIEHVSAHGRLPSGQSWNNFQLFTSTAGSTNAFGFFFVMTSQGLDVNGVIDESTCGESVRLYADAGTAIEVLATRSSLNGIGRFFVTVSGYLVDVP